MRGVHRSLSCIMLCWLVLQAGCQSASAPSAAVAASCEDVPEWIERLAPWEGPALRSTQLITFTDKHNDAVHILRYDVALSHEALVMAAQTTLGLPVYESVLRSGCLTVSRNVSELAGLPADHAVTDFILANWPAPALSSALEEAGYTLLTTDNQRTLIGPEDAALVRIVLPTSEVDNRVQISHFDIPLEITVQILDQRVGSP